MEIRTPARVLRTWTQRYDAPPERVFPLLCPVREVEWVDGWSPLLVISECGIAERDCVFLTSGDPADSIWTVLRHEPEIGIVEFLKVTPGETVCRIEIRVRPDGEGCCACDVAYQHTALAPRGERTVADFTEEAWQTFMRGWQNSLAAHLATA